MITLINILVFLAFFIFVINTNFRMTLQVAKIRKVEANIIFIFFLIGMNAYFASELFIHFKLFQQVPWSRIEQSSLALFATSTVCFSVIAVMKEITSKKLKTLLRLPLIGILCGVYFSEQQIFLGVIAVELFVSLALFRVREDYLYVFRQQAKSSLGLIFFSIGVILNLEFLSLLGILVFLIMKVQIINAIKLKLLITEEKNENDVH